MGQEKLDALIQASTITGGTKLRMAMADAMNYFGATKSRAWRRGARWGERWRAMHRS